jgi:hypothetical protein
VSARDRFRNDPRLRAPGEPRSRDPLPYPDEPRGPTPRREERFEGVVVTMTYGACYRLDGRREYNELTGRARPGNPVDAWVLGVAGGERAWFRTRLVRLAPEQVEKVEDFNPRAHPIREGIIARTPLLRSLLRSG